MRSKTTSIMLAMLAGGLALGASGAAKAQEMGAVQALPRLHADGHGSPTPTDCEAAYRSFTERSRKSPSQRRSERARCLEATARRQGETVAVTAPADPDAGVAEPR